MGLCNSCGKHHPKRGKTCDGCKQDITLRPCLGSCGKTFESTGPAHRICPTCTKANGTSRTSLKGIPPKLSHRKPNQINTRG